MPSFPSSPSIPRRKEYAILSFAGARTEAGSRWTCTNHMVRAQVLRALGVGRLSAMGMVSNAVKMELRLSSTTVQHRAEAEEKDTHQRRVDTAEEMQKVVLGA